MTCPSCGHSARPAARFCGGCGAAIPSPVAPPSAGSSAAPRWRRFFPRAPRLHVGRVRVFALALAAVSMIVLACLLYFKLTAGPELVADGIHVRLQRVSIHAADRFTSATSTVYLVRVLITNQSTSNYSYNAYNFQLQGPDAAVYRPNVGYARAPLLYGTVGPGQSVAGDLAFATPPAQQFSLLWQPIYGATPLSLALPQP